MCVSFHQQTVKLLLRLDKTKLKICENPNKVHMLFLWHILRHISQNSTQLFSTNNLCIMIREHWNDYTFISSNENISQIDSVGPEGELLCGFKCFYLLGWYMVVYFDILSRFSTHQTPAFWHYKQPYNLTIHTHLAPRTYYISNTPD